MSEQDDELNLDFVDSEKRGAIRTAFNARIRVSHDENGDAFFLTRDISDTGIFVCVNMDESFPSIGSQVVVQVQGLPIPAPELEMVVMRKGTDGYGLQFITASKESNSDE